MLSKAKSMLSDEGAAATLAGCIDGCTTGGIMGVVALVCPFCGCCGLTIFLGIIGGSAGGCMGGIINTIPNLIC